MNEEPKQTDFDLFEKEQEKNLGGRPRKEINFEELSKLCTMMCTKNEICAWFEIDEKTLTARIQEKYNIGFSDYQNGFRSEFKMSLRRAQAKSAINGNSTMLVWLGKQYLDQTDKIENSGDVKFSGFEFVEVKKDDVK